MGWEKRGMFRNVKALILNDLGTWRRGGNHTTTISSPVSRTESLETQCFKAFLFFVACDFSSPLIIRKNMFTRGEECAPLEWSKPDIHISHYPCKQVGNIFSSHDWLPFSGWSSRKVLVLTNCRMCLYTFPVPWGSSKRQSQQVNTLAFRPGLL